MKALLTNRKSKITLILASICMVGLIGTNTIIGHILERKVKQLELPNYNVSVHKIHPKLLRGSIVFSGIELTPDSAAMELASSMPTHPSFFKLEIKSLKFNRLKLLKALRNKELQIKAIHLQEPRVTLIKAENQESENATNKTFHLDSISIPGISGIQIDKIVFNELGVQSLENGSNTTKFGVQMTRFKLDRIRLKTLGDSTEMMQLDLDRVQVEMHGIDLKLPGGDYALQLKQARFKAHDKKLQLENLDLKPRHQNLESFAQTLVFTSEMFHADVKTISLENFDLAQSIRNRNCYLDSLLLSGLNLSILMDKNYPFNTEKRPLLPHQIVKDLNFPMHIKTVRIDHSSLLYQEKMPDFDDPMTVKLKNLAIKIDRLTSVKDSLPVRKNMEIQLKSDFMEAAKLRINFVFPLYMHADTFFYTGSLGKAPLQAFNRATFPALGARFTEGELQSIHFKGSANAMLNSGEMTMLYKDLKAEVVRKDQIQKNKVLSWAANTALLNGNPGNKGKTRTVRMQTERVLYKGFGNFMWKTFQSGIINTVLPAGNKNKAPKKSEKKRNKKRS